MKTKGRGLIGKIVVSEETGKKFGDVGDIRFITESGELLHLVLSDPTEAAESLRLEQDTSGRSLVPFSTVKSVGDFVIISEKEIV
jgi:sporulation protein YlmC with PRC-barrel domain